jgi:TonB family protein
MKPICRELQERLAGEGAVALRDDAAAQRHLEECPACFQVLESLARLDEALREMPTVDAPEPVLDALLARARVETSPPASAAAGGARFAAVRSAVGRWMLRRRLWWGLATAGSAVLIVTVSQTRRADRPPPEPSVILRTQPHKNNPAEAPTGQTRAPQGVRSEMTEEEHEKRALGYLDPSGPEDQARQAELGKREAFESRYDKESDAPDQKAGEKKRAHDELKDVEAGAPGGVEGGVPGGLVGGGLGGFREGVRGPAPVRVGGAIREPKLIKRVEPVYPRLAFLRKVEGAVVLEIEVGVDGHVTSARVLRSLPGLDEAVMAAVQQWVYAPTLLNGRPVPVVMTVTVNLRLDDETRETPVPSPEPVLDGDPARAFLAERERTEGLAFQTAHGYWANTYLPGDPALRTLRARLDGWDRTPLQTLAGFPLRLHDHAAPPVQPFDPPQRSALALYVHGDRRGLDGPGRLLVQVGLQGSARSGQPRPPMNVGLVLDLRGELGPDVAGDLRALALALARARDAGDRFSLIVAGRPGGIVVAPPQFKHGPVAVALDRLLTTGSAEAESLDLPAALTTALLEVGRQDDPESPLGRSAVLLVTPNGLGTDAGAVEGIAQQGAAAGIPLSVVGVGPADDDDIERLALAGQGRRRRLESRADAPRLIEAELLAAADVVARAVRLRIRLAPGVRLVEVVGSRRLDEIQAERVRAAERAVDLRLARSLGLAADRGEDEDGIQIVIPAFQAGDAHAVLLDVVAAGPGPVAEVSVRYKDLVFLRNGIAQAGFGLARGALPAGPLERNVTKNLLAWRLSRTLTAAAAALDRGEDAAAGLRQACAMRVALLARLPGLAGDRELLEDVALLDQYARLLDAARDLGTQRARVADSLRYAGRVKRLPRPQPQAAL